METPVIVLNAGAMQLTGNKFTLLLFNIESAELQVFGASAKTGFNIHSLVTLLHSSVD